ncbi:hypothetical protein CRYUN_Cryun10bG0097900 [Craigia yunnanensis]
MILPLIISYLYRQRKEGPGAKLFFIKLQMVLASVVLGLLTGVDDFLYAHDVARLPISTSALIISTQLAFTAGFAFVLVKQKFTSFTINAIFLLTVGAVVLALHTSSDCPANESKRQYFAGFFMTLGASALYGFVLPAIELTYKKAKQTITYSLVMEMQMIMSFSATVFCTIGMLFHNDFEAIPIEASEFELGQSTYCIVLVLNAILWQFFFMGAVGVISLPPHCFLAKLMSLTDILISPHGAQLTNMFLMDRNSCVMEFFPKGWLKLAGVGQYVYHWMASWSGMRHRGAWRDPDGEICPYSEDDRRCMSLYKSGTIGYNETYFAE